MCYVYIYIYIYIIYIYIYIYWPNVKITSKDQCDCRNKNNCPLDGNCQASDIIYKCIA